MANKLLSSSADSRNRAASGKPTECSNMPTDPGIAMARRRFFILKVIVAPHFFLSCYFNVKLLILTLAEVQLLHNATLSEVQIRKNVLKYTSTTG